MKYTAEIWCPLSMKRVTVVEFDNEYKPGLKKETTPEWAAKCAATRKGVRNVQYLCVKNIRLA